eukprot:Tamp_16400.p1 GENE.Tamp_16400~~Tamp_16400.p1  ORF type:complete len:236 (-),score=34.83 Tamp_16400:615-1322(-)
MQRCCIPNTTQTISTSRAQLRKFGLLPSSAWADSDADDFERDEEEASRRRDAAAKMPVNTSAEEAYAWHEAYDRAQEEARQYRYKHAEEIERQEWEQAEKDAEEETSCCGYGRFSGLSARFNGTTHRDPGMFRPNETDQDFWRRYGEGHLTNRTLKGLYDLKLAASFNDCEEIQRLVEDDGVDPGNTLRSLQRAYRRMYAAARHGSRRKRTQLPSPDSAPPRCLWGVSGALRTAG